MKNLSIIAIYFLCLIACQHQNNGDKTQKDDDLYLNKLVGKTIEYKYGDDIYMVTIDTDSTLHWWAAAGSEKGIKASEKYKSEVIDNKLFITWEEENGIGVSQILDFEKAIVHNHILKDRKINIGKGKIKILP